MDRLLSFQIKISRIRISREEIGYNNVDIYSICALPLRAAVLSYRFPFTAKTMTSAGSMYVDLLGSSAREDFESVLREHIDTHRIAPSSKLNEVELAHESTSHVSMSARPSRHWRSAA